MDEEFVATASLLGERTRATMLLKLLDGKALPAGELAFAANVSAQTASGHLALLIEGGLISVERQGRHRYYRLAGEEVAAAIESVMGLMPSSRQSGTSNTTPAVGTLAYARTCYSHLAGWLGVQLVGTLQEQGILVLTGKVFSVTEPGRAWFEELGVRIPRNTEQPMAKFAHPCADWSERKPHLAGTLGVSLYRRMVELEWLAPIAGTRAVRLTSEGKRELAKRLGIRIR